MSQDTDANLSEIENRCKDFVSATREFLQWEWDGRFLLMLSVMESHHREEIEPLVQQCFGHKWSREDDLPAAARDILGGIGGLRARQYLLTTDPASDPMLFCAWWPWGGGGKVSLRFGAWSALVQGTARADMRESFKTWFE
jgi:hypothetical protein